MTFSADTVENTPIDASPACPKCSALMDLARIEPEKPGFDLRTFECPTCQHVETVVVKFR
jgi:DNA polymerase III alpha subunit (gram-positive type)